MSGAREAVPARGRPRDAARDAAILDATLRLLVEVGYDQLSIESVAAEAGVGKPTVYRRHAGKAALVAAAVEHRVTSVPPATKTSDLREALLETVRWLAEQIAGQEIGLLGALFAGMRGDPDLAAEMRRILRRDEAAMTEHPFRSGVEGGEHLVPRAAELFAEISPALIVHRLIVVGEPCDQSFVEHVVDDILLPLLQRR
ncbi:TetR/AcrR family transcriptional regulator [Actinoallomurus iriomotensis]|uniref:TetR family transcriptional regulator n=1 Tax=Actinoallomurus iriomotensis TaxID=478107 RepID=A0A9W6RV84_9ACTN|nr:TetR/AcrR family transcriptional regulator [Actinoallomurus iriomotensis]GLY83231.1 TetR family transcriptional regulator [Actinoallomurus iriomotensis]